MSTDGGRLGAHHARTKDFRRRKDGKIKGSDVIRFKNGEQINFDKIDPDKLIEIKNAIQRKGTLKRRKEILLVVASMIIACGLVYFFYIKMTD